jgi:peptide/nickel transport system permease protein
VEGRDLTRLIGARLLLLVPSLLVLTFVMFAAMTAWFGSPSMMMLGRDADPQAVRAMDAQFGFDRPVAVQYGNWIAAAAQGDFGRSYTTQQPVASMILPALPVTLELSTAAILLASALAVGVNSLAVGRAFISPIVTAVSVVGVTVPNFMLGASMLYVLSIRLRWLPTTGWVPWSQGIGPHLLHLLMPVATLCAFYTSSFSMVYRAEYRDASRQLYVRAARAKGISESRVSFRHILPNAVLPVITYAGLSLGQLIGGAVVTETMFTIPGMGRLLVTAITAYDYPVILALTLLILIGVALANLAADLLYMRFNPQVRLS